MTDESTGKILNMGLDSLTQDAKAQEDYSTQTDELIAGKVETLIKAGRLDDATEEMLVLEKKCRQASDAISCSKLIKRIVKMYWDAGDRTRAMEQIVSLTKKRGQLRRATTDLVHMCTEWLDVAPLKGNKALQLELMKVLEQITEGKIFVEVERARLIQRLAGMKEEEGNIEEAANLMQEVQVETFGSMDRIEKSKFILNQMRLFLLKKDYIRVQIASRKINPKFLEADDFQEIKQTYYGYMVTYWLHEENFFEVAQSYEKMYNTPVIQAEKAKWEPILQNWILYLLLSPHSDTLKENLEKLVADVPRRKLDVVGNLQALLKEFLDKKLMVWPLKADDFLQKHKVFTESKSNKDGMAAINVLRKRVNQHNIRIASMYYERIQIARLCELMKLTQKEVEAELSELVVNKSVSARIDRPAGVVRFGGIVTTEDNMNSWAGGIDKVLDLVQETCHLISKERMIQEARAKLKKK